MKMKVTEFASGQTVILAVSGRVDSQSAPELRAKVDEVLKKTASLTFDLAKLEYISSSGLRVLLAAKKCLSEPGALRVENVPPPVRDVFGMTGFDDLLGLDEEAGENPRETDEAAQPHGFADVPGVPGGKYIIDVDIVSGDADMPIGGEKLNTDLNKGTGGARLYLCVKRGNDIKRAITGLAVAQGRDAKAPAGFEKINVDLNEKTGGKYLYLCKEHGGQRAVEDIQVRAGSSDNISLDGYERLNCDLNDSAGGEHVYIFWR